MNLSTPHGERLHRHQILQHSGRRVGCGAAARAVVDGEREGADDLLLLIEDERAPRPNVFHVGKGLRVPGIMRPPGGGLFTGGVVSSSSACGAMPLAHNCSISEI